MAVYKVPQDVEAEDKLLGPFSFKQFIFLIIAVASIGVAYVLSRLLLPLGLLPLPIAIFFGTLALPLRKDQPMEVYLAAIISFFLKPKKRLWYADGVSSLIQVVAPQVDESTLGKTYTQQEVQNRLSYLANIVDSHGWSVRGVSDPNGSSMHEDLYNEAQTASDLLDEDNSTNRNIDSLITQADNKRRQEMVERMQQTTIQPTTQQSNNSQTPQYTEVKLNPYPSMSQSVIKPLSQGAAASPAPVQTPPQTQPAATATNEQANNTPDSSKQTIDPAIMDLANNHKDLSIESIQREANRIENKSEDKEVVISLH